MIVVSFSLPWLHRDLSPNARVHWSVKARATKQARFTAKTSAMHALGRRRLAGVHVHFCYAPPSRRRRDKDNLIAATKAYQDGIADALRIDDAKFTTSYAVGAPEKGGAVHVEIRGLEC